MSRKRKRFAVGEIVGLYDNGWPEAYWYKIFDGPNDKQGRSTSWVVNAVTKEKRLIQDGYYRVYLKRGILSAPAFRFRSSDFYYIHHSVYTHHALIVHKKRWTAYVDNYYGLPFEENWNPEKEGSFFRATWEIKEDLGPRPSNKHQLSIVDHSRGFVRGNLKWSHRAWNLLEACIRGVFRVGGTAEEMIKLVEEVRKYRTVSKST